MLETAGSGRFAGSYQIIAAAKIIVSDDIGIDREFPLLPAEILFERDIA
jgi:hypothetical protein